MEPESPMNCPSCGHENREGAGFCRECSASLAPALECASCGQQSPPASKFCDGCGSPLAAPSAAAASDREPRAYMPKHLADADGSVGAVDCEWRFVSEPA